jgi:excisionase family DNA binding protein
MSNHVQELTTTETTQQATLTIKEIRDILKIGSNSAYNLIHSKAFPVIKIGHSYRIPQKSFYAWLNESRTVNF